MFNIAKNFMTGKAAQMYANSMIARYGEVRDLKIDTQNKSVDVVCMLHGETQPLTVRIDKYEVKEKAGKTYVQIVKCTCSRLWVQNLVEDFGVGRQLEVPPWAVSSL
ncbi:MAG: hypothetical protein JWM35_434 [Verrucomicrobia bacterium]|nr:hypothetical protein [Verrucomicrobiota bacterium]